MLIIFYFREVAIFYRGWEFPIEDEDEDSSLRLTTVTSALLWLLFAAKLRLGVGLFLGGCRPDIGQHPICASSQSKIVIKQNFVSELPFCFLGG